MGVHPDVHTVCTVVSARNESTTIVHVLGQLHRVGVGYTVVIVNGCSDKTLVFAKEAAARLFAKRAVIVNVTDALGYDVPRAVGAYVALRRFPSLTHVLLIDGDWQGGFAPMLTHFIEEGLSGRTSLLLTRRTQMTTSPDGSIEQSAKDGSANEPYARMVLGIREALDDSVVWQRLLRRIRPDLMDSAPSVLPMLIERETLERVSPFWLYHPGLWFALCVRDSSLRVSVTQGMDGRSIGNRVRSAKHQLRMRETILGDTLEGCRLLNHDKPSRWWAGRRYDGYHLERRVDLLRLWQSQLAGPGDQILV